MHQQRIVVVGAGIIGLSTAYHLLMQGEKHVVVLEQATVNHSRASSHGLSRLLRFEYGSDTFYSEMVRLSLEGWQQLEQQTGRSLYMPTGVLVLGNEHDNFTLPSYHALHNLNLTPERLSRSLCTQRFPQFDTQDFDIFTYNKDAGMLHASACLQALRDYIVELGGTIVENSRVTAIQHENSLRPIQLKMQSGTEIAADRVVVATGPWVHELLSELQLPVRLTRQYLLYFANLSPRLFGKGHFPAFIADDLYGFPLHNTCWPEGPSLLKAASHAYGAPVSANDPAYIDQHVINEVKAQLYRLIPALEDATLARIESYMYDVSFDENFILDYMPDDARIIVATGMTGHAFKFGTLLGEILANMVCDTPPILPTERFQLSRMAALWREQVHSVA